MRPHRISVLNGLSLALLGLALSACDTAPTQVDQHFGMAVRQAQAQQTQRAGMHQRMHPDTSAQMPHRSRGAMPMPMPMPMPMQPGMHERHHPASVDTDGPSAQAAIERYQESFQAPPSPAPIFNIGMGTPRSR
jgi:hypothetical protein